MSKSTEPDHINSNGLTWRPDVDHHTGIPFMGRVLLVLLVFAPVLIGQEPELLRHFDYDQRAPLNVKEVGIEWRGNVAVHDISYASPRGGLVPAYLVVPGGKGPFAAVIWGHWYMPNSEFLNRKEFLEEAVALAPCGLVSLLIDGPIARPGYVGDADPLSERNVSYRLQSVIDMRRGADLLLARNDVDRKRLGYVGHSYSASTGAFLAGIDKRFAAFVLMAGNLSIEVDKRSREFQEFRKHFGTQRVDSFFAEHSWLDYGKFVAHAAPAAVFLQYATKEDYLTPERASEYYSIVSDPKELKVYDAPHALNAEARRDRVRFLAQRLGLRSPDPASIALVPEIPQPAHEQ